MSGALRILTPNRRAIIIINAPTKGSPICRNSYIVLMRIISEPAVCQPQAPLKGALNPFQKAPNSWKQPFEAFLLTHMGGSCMTFNLFKANRGGSERGLDPIALGCGSG